MSLPEVAFIGLGAMGFGMATNLVKCGYSVTGFDVWAPTLERFVAAGGKKAVSPAAAAAGKQVCVCMVATAAQAQTVLIDGVDVDGRHLPAAAPALPQGAAILLCSTVPAGYVHTLAQQLADPNKGIYRPDLLLVDAPVSGGATRAAEGTLTIMAAGEERSMSHAAARAVLAAMTDPARLYLVPGGLGAGSNTKAVHQVLAANQILSASEAMGLALRLGLPRTDATFQALMDSPGASWMLGHRGPRMLATPAFQPLASAIDIITKDAAIVTSEARRAGFVAPMAGLVENVLYTAVTRGFGRDDDSSLLRLYVDMDAAVATEEKAKTEPETPSAAKLALVIDLLRGIHLVAAAESLAFAQHVHLDLDLVLGLCIDAAGGSAMLRTHGPAMVALLRGTDTVSTAAADSSESLKDIADALNAAVDAAQQIKAPVFLGGQALSLLRTALRSFGSQAGSAAPASIIQLWM